MRFSILPVAALRDNYIWFIVNNKTRACLIVDPGEVHAVSHAILQHALKPHAILLTHHHWDHTNGAEALKKKYNIPVFGSANEEVLALTHPLKEKDVLEFKAIGVTFRVIAITGHTRGHIAYYGENRLFCGDTLFTGGCGRVFEGTYEDMYRALCALARLPDSTQVYCGHEYTVANLAFALAVEPASLMLQKRMRAAKIARAAGKPTVPATLGLEKATNPFLRVSMPDVKAAAQKRVGHPLPDPVAVFAALRQWKDIF